MDPRSGELYPSVKAAREAGVQNPVSIEGDIESIKHISDVLKEKELQNHERYYEAKINPNPLPVFTPPMTSKQKNERSKKNKRAKESRKKNRSK